MGKAVFIISFVVLCSAMTFAQTVPYSFMGSSLGMSLADFKAQHDQDYFWINDGDPSKHPDKKHSKMVPTPACTDSFRGFPGDVINLAPGEVLCNPAPGEINTMYRQFAGVTARQILFRFYRNKLWEILILIAGRDYPTVRSAFEAKYGPPKAVSSESYQNKFGARWDGEVAEWVNGPEFIKTKEGPWRGPGQDDYADQNTSVLGFIDRSLMPEQANAPILDF